VSAQQVAAKQGFTRRTALPAGAVLAVWAAASLVYWGAPRLGDTRLHDLAASVSGLTHILVLLFGALAAYPVARFRGASPAERAAASLVTPLAWIASELVRVRAFFTPGETLYYGLNPLFLQVLFFTVMMMGVSEILCRLAWRRRGAPEIRVLTAGPAAAILAGIASFALIFAWGYGVHSFYVYMRGYRALFF